MSKLRLAAYIAMRIARSKRSTTLSIVTVLSILGLAFGVFALTVVLAVTDGFQQTFENRILGIFPHLVVSRSAVFSDYEPALEKIRETEGVVGATPLSADDMMVAHGVHRAGATVQGIDLPSVESVLQVGTLMKSGQLQDLAEMPALTRVDGRWRMGLPVEGMSLTIVAREGRDPIVLVDDRITPEADSARVKLLDLRKDASPTTLTARGGTAAIGNDAPTPVKLGGRGDGYSIELELLQGDWELAATGERLQLEAEQLYLIVLHDGPDGPESIVSVEPARPHLGERKALVRVIDARAPRATDALDWQLDEASEPFATTRAGEHTGMVEVAARLPGVLLGAALAAKLKATVGDELTFVTPLRGIDNKWMGAYGMLPSSAHFRVVGTFEAGFYDHDVKLAIVNLSVSQRFLNRGKMVRTIAVKTRSLDDIDATKQRLRRSLDPQPVDDFVVGSAKLDQSFRRLVSDVGGFEASGDAPFVSMMSNLATTVNLLRYNGQNATRSSRFQIFDWKQKNQNLFGALQLQKVVLSIFFFIIILVGSFVVVGSQIMVIHEKTAEIAIFKAMGATPGLVRLVFTLQGLLVALVGLFVGLVVGIGTIALIDAVDYKLEASIYLIDHLPVKLEWVEVVLVAVGAVAMTLVTTQISAARAANKTIVAGLRQVD